MKLCYVEWHGGTGGSGACLGVVLRHSVDCNIANRIIAKDAHGRLTTGVGLQLRSP